MDTEDLTTKDMKVILHEEEHWACLPSADAAHCTWGTTSCPSTEPAWSTARWRKPPSSWPTPQTRSSWRSFPIIRPAWLWRDLTMVRGSVWISLCIFALRLLLASSSRVGRYWISHFLSKQWITFVYWSFSSRSFLPRGMEFIQKPQIEGKNIVRECFEEFSG